MCEIIDIQVISRDNHYKEVNKSASNKEYYQKDNIKSIMIICDNQQFNLIVENKSYSESYFVFENIQSIIGQKLVGIEDNKTYIREDYSDYDDRVAKIYNYVLHFDDGKMFWFNLITESDSYYYDGSVIINRKSNIFLKYQSKSIIIVVGLPGAGKTSYINSIKEKNDQIYDNVCNFFVASNQFTSKRNIFASAKFCHKYIYEDLIESLSITNPKEVIQTICFDIDIKQSKINIKRREDPDDIYLNNNNNNDGWGTVQPSHSKNNKILKFINEKINSLYFNINEFAHNYNPTNICYINPIIIPTYSIPETYVKCARKKK